MKNIITIGILIIFISFSYKLTAQMQVGSFIFNEARVGEEFIIQTIDGSKIKDDKYKLIEPEKGIIIRFEIKDEKLISSFSLSTKLDRLVFEITTNENNVVVESKKYDNWADDSKNVGPLILSSIETLKNNIYCRAVYDDEGNPLKTDNYFKWSKDGAKVNEPIFVVGSPGSTYRLKTMAQLEYMRDYTYRNLNFFTNGKVKYYNELITEDPSNARKYEDQMLFVGNGAKVFKYSYKFLTDDYSMARKRDFENKFKSAVQGNPEMNKLYGHLWDGIEAVNNEFRQYASKISAYSISPRSSSDYFLIAKNLIKLAHQLQKPDSTRAADYQGAKLDSTIQTIFPDDFNVLEVDKGLELQADYMMLNLGVNNPLMQKTYGGNKGKAAVEYAKAHSQLTNAKDVIELANKGAEAILNSNDVFISYILATQDELLDLLGKQKDAKETEKVLENELGRALFEVYGTTIPPDATFTPRISDGELKNYEYNGTIAPVQTTFYGMYDRYYSNNEKYPWGLPERWLNPKEGFDMSTQYNFISTNDITGGSSGSAVINKEGEVIGAAFDGNIESIPGNYLYNPTNNRMVSVSSEAILQILKYIGDAERIADELEAGKIPEKYKVVEEKMEVEEVSK